MFEWITNNYDYILFGIVDNGVMLIGAFFGLGLEKYLPKNMQVGLGAVLGAGLGNALSDFAGGAVSAAGHPLGCGGCQGEAEEAASSSHRRGDKESQLVWTCCVRALV